MCGKYNEGSSSLCRVYKGAVITTSTGIAVSNYAADFRMYTGGKITCSASSYYCMKNNLQTYTSATCTQLGNSTTDKCAFGRIYVRQGYVQSKYAAIYSSVANDQGIYIGNTADTLYDWTAYNTTDGATVNVSKGPMIRASDTTNGRGIYMDTDTSKWTLANGLVGGAKTYGNEVPYIGRSGYSEKNITSSTYQYAYLG